MKNFRKQIAAWLAVALFASCFSFNGLAAEVERRWELSEDGEWTFWRNGEMQTDKLITEPKNGVKKSYYLKEDGIMASDELIEIDGHTSYAYPDGHIATNQWIYLNDEGKWHSGEESGTWYYFGKDGERYEDRMKMINKKYYRFDENGEMVSKNFAEWDGVKYYFQRDGERAAGKWLNINGDWYCFNSDGSFLTATTASSSDAAYEFDEEGRLVSDIAPCRVVSGIELKGDETSLNAEVGQEVMFEFDVQLATDSDATEQGYTKNFDQWLDSESREVYDTARNKTYKFDNGKLYLTYTPQFPNEVSFTVGIDEVGGETVTVTSDWAESDEKADAQKTEAIVNLLSSDDVGTAVQTVKELSATVTDNSQIKEKWLEEAKTLEQLDESYAMMNKNVISQTTTETAKTLMGSGNVQLIGGSLNAEAGQTVELAVDKGGDAELPETYEKQVSFGLSVLIDGSETSKLDIPVVIKMPIPDGMSGDGLRVYHISDDGTAERLKTTVSGNEVSFVTDSFSDYVFAGKASTGGSTGGNTNNNNSSSSSSGSSSSSNRKAVAKSTIPETPGSWNKLANGKWQFLQANGAPYINTWIYVKGQWYWINPTGMMAEGWQTINGKRYYLTPESGAMKQGWLQDGTSWYYLDTTGAMQTGWVSVGGKWYYMDANGVMMFNRMTPDGFKVDESGSWVQ